MTSATGSAARRWCAANGKIPLRARRPIRRRRKPAASFRRRRPALRRAGPHRDCPPNLHAAPESGNAHRGGGGPGPGRGGGRQELRTGLRNRTRTEGGRDYGAVRCRARHARRRAGAARTPQQVGARFPSGGTPGRVGARPGARQGGARERGRSRPGHDRRRGAAADRALLRRTDRRKRGGGARRDAGRRPPDAGRRAPTARHSVGFRAAAAAKTNTAGFRTSCAGSAMFSASRATSMSLPTVLSRRRPSRSATCPASRR